MWSLIAIIPIRYSYSRNDILINPPGFLLVILIPPFLNQHIDNDSLHRVPLKGPYSSNHLVNSIPADLIMPNKLYAAKKGILLRYGIDVKGVGKGEGFMRLVDA